MNIVSPYTLLAEGMPEHLTVTRLVRGQLWTGAELSDGSAGIAMRSRTATLPRQHGTLIGLSARQAAGALFSWNLEEASDAMAVVNAWYNSEARLKGAGSAYDYRMPCTRGMDTRGKTVALVGHLSLSPDTLAGAARVYVLERQPQPGDYPDAACEEVLPRCDLVIITGSAFVNKTIPRLLELSGGAERIVIGPSVPLCPALMRAGIARLCGMAVGDKPRMFEKITQECAPGYRYGGAWMISGYENQAFRACKKAPAPPG